eukprot:535792-Pelagomonas_calceolata.AAC.5
MQVSLLGCGVSTGWGAVDNTAKVRHYNLVCKRMGVRLPGARGNAFCCSASSPAPPLLYYICLFARKVLVA